MPSHILNWEPFWPGWAIFALDFSTTDGVTAAFIGAILLLLLLFLIPSLWISGTYWRRVNFYLKLLDGVTEETVIEKRQGLINREQEASVAPKWKRILSEKLWREFDETLVEHNGKLYNNLDAEHFFNGSTLARRIVDSRLLPTGAALLTGVGVLGTFLGLQLGLTGLNLDGDVAQIQGEIKLLAQSASVAFITSVWGVASSLLLNFIEKLLHGLVMRRINVLQNTIDGIFPRFPILEVFADIRESGRDSRDALYGLAEQIGNRMQESMDSFSQNMSSSLAASISQAATDISTAIGGTLKTTIEESLVPAIESMASVTKDLAERQAKGSEDTMKSLLERFMDAMGQEGQGQREAMQTASQDIRNAMSGLTGSMGDFFASLKKQQETFSSEQDARAHALEQAVLDMVSHQSNALNDTNQKLAEMLTAFAGKLGQEQTRQADLFTTASGDVRQAIGDLAAGMREFFTELGAQQKSMIAEQDERTRALEAAVQRLVNQQSEAQNENTAKVSQMLHDFLSRMTDEQIRQTGSLNTASEGVRDVLTDMGGTLTNFMKALEDAQIRLREEQDTRSKGLEQLVQDTMATAAHILKQGEALQQHVDSSQQAMDSVVGKMVKAGDSMANVTANLKVLGSEIGQSVDKAASSIENSVSHAERLFSENAAVAKGIEGTLHSLQGVQNAVEEAMSGLKQAVTESSDGFSSLSRHYRDLQETMQQHIDALEKQVAKLLQDYSDHVYSQTVQRLHSWDSETKNFCDSITSAVNAMGEVVESIEIRTSNA